jgi:pimeloyl-ACP methyl ester carboxylesterase
MATFVLVHGGGHGGWCYKPVARRLRAAGHEVYAPSLTGLADRAHLLSASVGLDTHITDIVRLLEYEDLADVIIVGHSYGGMVITGVADQASRRVGHRVYLDAAYPKNGQSLYEHAQAAIGAARQSARIVDGVELVLFPDQVGPEFYGVTDPAQIAWARTRLTAQPWKCFEQKLVLTNESAMRAIPESHIICSVTKPGRDMDALMATSNGRVWDIDTGHDLMLTEPEWVTDKLIRIANVPKDARRHG